MWISSTICWRGCLFSNICFELLHQKIRWLAAWIYVWDFCSTGLHVCFCTSTMLFLLLWLCSIVCAVLEMEPRALPMLSKCSTRDLNPSPSCISSNVIFLTISVLILLLLLSTMCLLLKDLLCSFSFLWFVSWDPWGGCHRVWIPSR
jgi:hypothetical protein